MKISLKELLNQMALEKAPNYIYIDIQNCNELVKFKYIDTYKDYRTCDENSQGSSSLSEGCLWLKDWIKWHSNEQNFFDKTKVTIKEDIMKEVIEKLKKKYEKIIKGRK